MSDDHWGRGGDRRTPYPSPGNPYGAPQPAPQAESGALVAAIIGVLVLLIVVGVAGLWFLGRDDGDSTAGQGGGASPESLEDRLIEEDGGGFGEPDGLGGQEQDPDVGGYEELPPGLGYDGYVDYPGAMCDGGDTWVYAGEGGGSAAVICASETGGNLYLRGDFASGTVRGDVAMDVWIDVAEGIYTVSVDGGLIEFYGTMVWFDGDDIEDLAEFESFWYDDTITNY